MDGKKLNNFKAWLREEELSQNTIDSYVFTVTDFFKKYQEINKENLIQWKQALMDAGKSPKTVNLRLCAIERWCQFAGIDIGKVKRGREVDSRLRSPCLDWRTGKRSAQNTEGRPRSRNSRNADKEQSAQNIHSGKTERV